MRRNNPRFSRQDTLESVGVYVEIARGWAGEGKIEWATAYYAVARARIEMFMERHPDNERYMKKRLNSIVEEQAKMHDRGDR